MEPHVNWSHEEIQQLLAVWSEEKMQRDLQESCRNEKVYRELSGRLASVGMSRSAKQCRLKIKKLKLEYRKIKKCGDTSGKIFQWYDTMDTIMSNMKIPAITDNTKQSATVIREFMISDMETDSPSTSDITGNCNSTSILCPISAQTPRPIENPQDPGFYSIQLEGVDGPSTSTAVTSTAAQPPVKDMPLCCWSNGEVQALLTLWANPAVQEELCLNVRNDKVYIDLSAKLASLGFNKAPRKCREKIKKLKQEYKRIKNGPHRAGSNSTHTSAWFTIMDDVLSSKAAAARCAETTNASQSDLDVNTDDETQWLPDEVQVLLTLWAQPNIQKQVLTTATNNKVYKYLSSELMLVGFNKTPRQCSIKVNNLKEEYRKIKAVKPYQDDNSNWFAILDSVLGSSDETSTELDSFDVLTCSKSPEDEYVKDTLRAVWTSDEVKVLLSRWAEEGVQEQLRSSQRNERVFAQLSSDLATQGFDKTTSQCRSKIKVLKRKYRKIKEMKDSKKQKSRWFAMMDKVLGCRKPVAETTPAAEAMDSTPTPTSLQTSQLDLSETVEDLGCHLSISSLCFLVPTLRLMCAFAWQVVQCCNVPHYGKVEELVRLVTELAPELLTPREKVQLLLRLRARTVLELCRSESAANLLTIQSHLKFIQDLSMGSTCDQDELEELRNSKSNFLEVVHILLEDTEERKTFFRDVYPIHYDQHYEATLHSLVWKFISRLDNLLPVPDIKQIAEWLSTTPSVMEECGQLVLEPDQLKTLLHFHQQQSGRINKYYSQSMFLPRLSLPPKTNSKQLAPKQQESSTDNKDEGQLDCRKDEEPDEENHTGVDLTLEDTANCSNLNNRSHSRLQTCSLCPYSDSQVSGLMQHIRTTHLIPEPSQVQTKEPDAGNVQKVDAEICTAERRIVTTTCKYCAKVFKDVSTLNNHIKTHTLAFHCDKCEKKYSSRDSLNVHRRIHTGETPYLCSHCGRGFRSSYVLNLHVRIHTGDRRYKCHICGKMSIQHLTRHMRMHRGEKNYLCTECGKAFLSSGELRLHMRFHTGERPYTCKHCGRGFTAKCHLTVHMRQHTGESPYRCSVCPKSFHTLRAQKRHMMIHSNKKSFQCLKCGKIFRQKDTFKIHVETHK